MITSLAIVAQKLNVPWTGSVSRKGWNGKQKSIIKTKRWCIMGQKGDNLRKCTTNTWNLLGSKEKKSTKLRTIKQRWQRWFKKKGGSSVHKSR